MRRGKELGKLIEKITEKLNTVIEGHLIPDKDPQAVSVTLHYPTTNVIIELDLDATKREE